MEIKELAPTDIRRVIEVWEQAGLSYRGSGRDSEGALAAQMAEAPDLFIGAFEGGSLVAVAIGSDDGRKGWINRLAVLPMYRRKGIASSLIEELEARLRKRGRGIFSVCIDADNVGSLNLFVGSGYTHHEEIVYLSKKDDSCI